MLHNIFSNEVAIKVFYAYLAVCLGNTGLDAAEKFKPDVAVEKITTIEKRLDRMENLMIDFIKGKNA